MSYFRILAVLALILASACERSYGIHRKALVEEIPDGECVRRILDTTPGITSVEEHGTSIREDSPPSDSHDFFYEGPQVKAILSISRGREGAVLILQYFSMVNWKPPQVMIDSTRAVMIEVERRLEAECGVKGLTSKVQEVCIRVKCGEDE